MKRNMNKQERYMTNRTISSTFFKQILEETNIEYKQ